MRYCTPLLAVLLVAVAVGYVGSAEPAPAFTLTEAAWVEGLCLMSSDAFRLYEYNGASRTIFVRITPPPGERAADVADFRTRRRHSTEATAKRLVAFLNRHLASPVRLSMSKY